MTIFGYIFRFCSIYPHKSKQAFDALGLHEICRSLRWSRCCLLIEAERGNIETCQPASKLDQADGDSRLLRAQRTKKSHIAIDINIMASTLTASTPI